MDPKRCKLWLRAMEINPETSRKTLLRRCMLVCSDHFSPEDLVHHEGCTCLTPTAVPLSAPAAGPSANETAPQIQGNTESRDYFPVEIQTDFEEPVVAGLQQSAEVKKKGFQKSHRKKSRHSNFLPPSPEQATNVPCVKFSSSETNLTSAPSESEDSEDLGAYTNTEDLDDSMSSAEKTVDAADSSFVSFTSPSMSSQGSSCDAAAGERSVRKWIVCESKLFELFQNCPECGDAIEEQDFTSCGMSPPSECEVDGLPSGYGSRDAILRPEAKKDWKGRRPAAAGIQATPTLRLAERSSSLRSD
ncbi:uncharacterized protein ABDE67_010979 [Symphorus nematophorus]